MKQLFIPPLYFYILIIINNGSDQQQPIANLSSSTPLPHVSFDWDEKGSATFHHPRPPMAHIGRDGRPMNHFNQISLARKK